jgi:F0F1-type ATP synthase beta subunit
MERQIVNHEIKNRKARKITIMQFADFLNEKGVANICSECNHQAFAINTTVPNEVALIGLPVSNVGLNGILEPLGTVLLAELSITCENCGHTKMFALSAVMKWLDEQQKAEGKNE